MFRWMSEQYAGEPHDSVAGYDGNCLVPPPGDFAPDPPARSEPCPPRSGCRAFKKVLHGRDIEPHNRWHFSLATPSEVITAKHTQSSVPTSPCRVVLQDPRHVAPLVNHPRSKTTSLKAMWA